MNTLRSFSVLAALSLAGAAYAQTQVTPDPQTGPPQPSQSSQSAPASESPTPGAASESAPNANPDPSSASTPHQRSATRMAAAGSGKVTSGMEVKTQTGDPLGKVAALVPSASGTGGYAVIASTGGRATAVPYSIANAMVRDDVIVMDKARLQNAPKVQQDQTEDGSSNTWQKKADAYWSQYSSMSPGHDVPT